MDSYQAQPSWPEPVCIFNMGLEFPGNGLVKGDRQKIFLWICFYKRKKKLNKWAEDKWEIWQEGKGIKNDGKVFISTQNIYFNKIQHIFWITVDDGIK